MQIADLIPIVVTFIGVASFAVLFTILYKSYANSQISEIKSGKKDIEIIDEVIYERQEKVKKRKKRVKILKTVAYYLALVIIVPVFIFSLISRFQNNVLMIGNQSMMVVASPSMSTVHESNKYIEENNLTNQFDKFDIIILERVESAADLNLYDVICYQNEDDINIIHRIKDIKYDTEIKYVTRGDANNTNDDYNPTFEDVVGRYTGKKINGLGIFIIFLQSYAGIITIVSLVYCLVMIDRNAEKINKVQRERVKQLEQVIDYSKETKSSSLKAKFHEVIYYKGFAYTFDENGFIEKQEIKDGPYKESSHDEIMKVVVDDDTSSVTEEKIVLEDTKGD